MKRLLAHPAGRFALKLVAAYVGWYLLYDGFLMPDGRLDAVISKAVAGLSGTFLAALGFAAHHAGRILWIEGTQGIEVVAGCNGLAVIGLFVGFVLAYPGTPWRRGLWLALGGVALFAANLVRITILALCQFYRPEFFDLVHRLGAKPMFYALVFVLWMGWMRWGGGRPMAPAEARRWQPALST